LLRASGLLGNQDIQIWCSIQLGDRNYTAPLEKLTDIWRGKVEAGSDAGKALFASVAEEMKALSLKASTHYSVEELDIKTPESGGGYKSIGLVEEKYADLVRTKKGNDGTYYKTNLFQNLSYVRKRAHGFASALFNQVKFSGTVKNCFEVLKQAVDNRLLDLDPSLAEQLMLAFKSVSGSKEEEWSQALTTCRRLLEGLADQLHPVDSPSPKPRLGQAQYVNRLWAFMDKAIESDVNKELAKAHVDFLGSWMEKTNKIANKGVHASVGQLESVKAVFHTYLVVADLLDYLDGSTATKAKPDINTATLDEIEALLDVSRATAKEIVKARIQYGRIDREILAEVEGVGPKTVAKAIAAFGL